MSLIRKNRDTFPVFPSFFDDFLSRDLFNWNQSNYSSTSTTIPAVNIRETDDNFEVEMASPGMDKKDFNIRLDGNTLTISSVKEQNQEDNKDNYSRREFSYQSFQRTFVLPKDVVDEDRISAQYENGLLKLWIPKREEAKQKGPRLIEIQ
ncbi:Hsp20/alpha crystallin family protein [Dyadobacter sp. Leaf189]|uniref:Hsp20/alpha crystallin family protein n=1 Tax=Dyadobacter sp. Leaf189 TaxID=1736295 RepID=UPI0006FF4FEC|nr:Hsp20/alpha crystallin family protein [Dyadobacter sp. Leaf189]KQS27000.1 heat-shock protein [Dyadobacter sp. Leaf189]